MQVVKKISSPVVAAILVFVLGTSATFLTWESSKDRTQQKSASELDDQAKSFVTAIQTRSTAIEELLRGTISLATNKDFNASIFDEYLDSLEIEKRYPSIDTIGYVPEVDQTELPEFISRMKSEGSANFSIYPAGERASYNPITYINTVNKNSVSNSMLGFDLQSDKNSKDLLDLARKNARPTVSSALALSGNSSDVFEPGIALMAPIYENTTPENKDVVLGYIYATIRIKTFIQSALTKNTQIINVSLYDGTKANESKLLYGIHHEDAKNSRSKTFTVAGRKWTAVIQGSLAEQSNEKNQSSLLLLLGIILSALVASFFLYIIRSKSREVELQKQLEIESAKDGLLSLASHQLRTPATSVKQYIGMIREGYVGEITPAQEEILTKAHESNERQLSIVNQILSLSKLESRTPSLNKKRLDMVTLVEDVVRDESFILVNKNLGVNKSSDQIFVSVDESYLRMVVENLLTNASKYSHENANIEIELSETESFVFIEVKDDGIGIEEKDFDDLFVLFHRVDNELSLNVSGTGIGLYVCKLIVDLHGGRIEVESTLGKGSIFTVILPKDDYSGANDDK